MKKILFYVTVALTVLAVSCQKKEAVADSVTVTSASTVNVPVDGDVVSIAFNANVAWTAKSSQDWLTLSPAQGDAGDKLTVKASVVKNETLDSRTAEVTITAGTASAKVTVIQGQTDALDIKVLEYEVSVEGGNVEVEVEANVEYSVTIPEAIDWVHDGGLKGMTASKVILVVDPSYDVEAREAVISISAGALSSSVKIIQAAFEPYYDMELPEGVGMFSGFGDGNPLVLAADATSFTIPVSTNMEHYCYFAPWDPEVGAAVETNDVGWIKFEYDNAKIVFTIEPNTGYVPREE